jgi:hypothetical protein
MADPSPNLVVNGSFEGSNGLAGWTIGGTVGDDYLPVAIQYDQASEYPTGAQGESVPTDNAPSASPDAAGSNGVYFVSDSAKNLSVYQYVYLTPGSYDIGFDTYATFNGFIQPLDANFSASIAGVQLADFEVSTVAPGTWATHSGEALVSTAGEYLVSFVFNTADGDSKDIVVDRAYVLADSSGGGVPIAPVPEPSSFALMLCGITLTGCMLRRKKHAADLDSPRPA